MNGLSHRRPGVGGVIREAPKRGAQQRRSGPRDGEHDIQPMPAKPTMLRRATQDEPAAVFTSCAGSPDCFAGRGSSPRSSSI